MTDEERMTQDEQTSAEQITASAQPSAAASVEDADTPAGTSRADARAEDGVASATTDHTAELERRLAELERQLAAEREAATDYMQRWQRAQADFSNFRRRMQQEQDQREALATGRALAAVLPALDSFQRAFATLPESLRGFSWIDGIALVELQLRRALDALGVQPVEAAPGQAFDPMRHESIGEVETDEHPAGHIAAVIQQGYEVRGLLLRPVLVQTARERASAAATPAETTTSAEAPEAAGAEGASS